MDENKRTETQTEVRRLRYAPGNMTVYDLVASRLGEDLWLVAAINQGCCMEVYDGQYLSLGYIAEKMRPRIGSFGESDLVALQSGIEALLA